MNREEAVRRIRWYLVGLVLSDETREAFNTLVPELVEKGADEKMLDAILCHVKTSNDFVVNGIDKEDVVAYLEGKRREAAIESVYPTSVPVKAPAIPKFSVGDNVKYQGVTYEITKVEVNDNGPFYSVRAIGPVDYGDEIKTGIGPGGEKDMVKVDPYQFEKECNEELKKANVSAIVTAIQYLIYSTGYGSCNMVNGVKKSEILALLHLLKSGKSGEYWNGFSHGRDSVIAAPEEYGLRKPVEHYDMVAKLEEHLANTPKEQLDAEWKALEKWNDVGPTVEEYVYGKLPKFKVGDKIRKIGGGYASWEITGINNILRLYEGKYKEGYPTELPFEEQDSYELATEDDVYPPLLGDAIKLYYETYGNGKGGFDCMSLPKFKDIVEEFVMRYGNAEQPKRELSEKDRAIIKLAERACQYVVDNGPSSAARQYEVARDHFKAVLSNGEPIKTENKSVDIPVPKWDDVDDRRVEQIINVLERNGNWYVLVNWLRELAERFGKYSVKGNNE